MNIFKKFFILIMILVFIILFLMIVPSPYEMVKITKKEPIYSEIQKIEISDAEIKYDTCALEYFINKYIVKINYEKGFYYYP